MYFCSRCHFRHLQGRFCPFGFVLKPVGPETLILGEFRACVRMKTSIWGWSWGWGWGWARRRVKRGLGKATWAGHALVVSEEG